MADGDGGSKGIFKPAVIPALGIDEIQAVTHRVVALQTEAGGQHGLFIRLGGDFPGFHRIELGDMLPVQHTAMTVWGNRSLLTRLSTTLPTPICPARLSQWASA